MLLHVSLCLAVTPCKNSKNKVELCHTLNTSVNKKLFEHGWQHKQEMECIRVHNCQFSPAGAVSLLVLSDTQLEIREIARVKCVS